MGFPRQDITLEERIGIGLEAAANRGVYGVVSSLARQYRTSRQFVYRLEERVIDALEAALAPRRPGPAGGSCALEVDRQHLDHSIVTMAMVARASERAITECLGAILRVEPSLGYVSTVLSRAAQAASDFNEGLHLVLPEAEVGMDELYARKKGNLVAVHPASLLILALKETKRVDGESWGKAIDEMAERGVEIARVASDGGGAIRASLARLARVEHRLDLWHALRHVGRAVGRLERTAYAAIGREEELRKKASRLPDSVMMGGVVHEDYHRAKVQARVDMERYEALRMLALWVRQALDPIEPTSGRIRTRAECLAELAAATELMRELGVGVAKKLADYLDKAGPGLLAYVDRLKELVGQMIAELGEEGVRLLCREWQLGRGLDRKGAREDRAKDYLRAHLLSLLYWTDGYTEVRKRLEGLLGSVLRGTSLVECVNSWLRPYAELRKILGQPFLDLFTLYRNSRVFKRGKRAGASPLQLAGIPTPKGDWTDWLGFPHRQGARRSVRSLPKAA